MTTKTLSLITATLLFSTNAFADTTLEDITVVSATRTTQNIQNVTSNVSVITAQDIEDRGYTTVTQALNSLAGITFTQNGGLGTTTSLYVRGMNTNSILVVIDGIRYNDITSTSGAPFAHLMIDDIAQIEVVKGAQSGIWGADAAAGVINIITKSAQSGYHGTGHLERGSFKTNKYGATLSAKTNRYHFKVSHNVIDSNSFTAQAPQGTNIKNFENDPYKNQTTNIQLGVNLNETNKVDVSHTIIDAVGNYDPFATPNGFSKSTTKDSFSTIKFNHIDSFNEVNLYANRSKFARQYITATSTSPYDGQVDEYGINSKIPYGKEDFVLIGTDYKRFEHKNSINQSFNNKGVFLTNNTFHHANNDTTIITESLRYDTYSAFKNKFTGKIGLKYISQYLKGFIASCNYGTAYRVPTLYELYAPGSTFGGVYYPIGNKNLNPETTKSFDVTVAYKDISVTYFNNKIDNLIQYTNGYNNITGTSKIDGMEITYSKNMLSNLNVTMNYTKLFSAKDKNGIPLIRRAHETLKVTADYYAIENLHVGADVEYVGSRTDTAPVNAQTGKYTVVNVTADYQITTAFQLYGKIVNLTDKGYQTVYGYATSPRTFYAGIRAKF